ncbi:DM13 domain-containing protein [Lyngbya confervoides]|uniref:DM13 domain-containing protein n=1 Tax=Lyngbya confervoides BDU141951 TaxID=1574623 RepID=A0ABD4T6U2_9CYAN|nr:DM13 domain-containing protein [Lyngbya confervoides]MCM1983982.1 DM13 domain-containing protein [Lyngbya confervoides BDU141951]
MKTRIFTGASAVLLAFTWVSGVHAQTPAPFATPSPVPTAQQPREQPRVLAAGDFVTVDQDHATTGTARIVEEQGQLYLEFDKAFDTARGPEVKVVLYKDEKVPVNIDIADYRVVDELQSFEGAQRYALPASINLDDYGAIAIWCAEFNVTFGYASLS